MPIFGCLPKLKSKGIDHQSTRSLFLQKQKESLEFENQLNTRSDQLSNLFSAMGVNSKERSQKKSEQFQAFTNILFLLIPLLFFSCQILFIISFLAYLSLFLAFFFVEKILPNNGRFVFTGVINLFSLFFHVPLPFHSLRLPCLFISFFSFLLLIPLFMLWFVPIEGEYIFTWTLSLYMFTIYSTILDHGKSKVKVWKEEKGKESSKKKWIKEIELTISHSAFKIEVLLPFPSCSSKPTWYLPLPFSWRLTSW